MAIFAKIDRQTLTVLARERKESPVLVDDPNKPKWVPVIVDVEPAFDPATEKTVPIESVNLNEVRTTWTVEALNQTELDQSDEENLRTRGVQVAFVLVELVDYLLANTSMTASDFTPAVRQTYADVKQIADRIK